MTLEEFTAGWDNGYRYVILSPFEDNPQERGQVLDSEADDGMIIVLLDREFRKGGNDDGLRECDLEQATWEIS